MSDNCPNCGHPLDDFFKDKIKVELKEEFKREKQQQFIELSGKIDQKEFHLSSKYIINATGVFSNKLMMSIASKFKIKASRGTHIVVDRSFLDSQNAIMIPKTIDGRVLFVIPWNDKTLIGTTDEESNEIDIDLITPLKDIDFILENVKHYLFKYPQKKDIKSVFTGLRPLVSNNDNSIASCNCLSSSSSIKLFIILFIKVCCKMFVLIIDVGFIC